MRVLGLSIIIIGLLLMNIVIQLGIWALVEKETYINYMLYCLLLIVVGIIISVIGYVDPNKKPLTEVRLKEILRSEEFNTTEILYRLLVEQKDS